MSSKSETGHAKNVANFEDLISFCTSYEATYIPSRESLKLVSLQALRTNALTKLQAVKVARTAFGNATNERITIFKNLRPLSTRVYNALAAAGAGDLITVDARTIVRKIYGKRAVALIPVAEEPTVPETEPTLKSISVSQQSYDSLIDHFTKLVELVSQQADYAPNETDLQVAGLGSLLTQMQSANSSVINSYTMFSNSCIIRDDVLYNPLRGLTQTAQAVKLYVKSLYGSTSPQYKQVNAIRFRDRIPA